MPPVFPGFVAFCLIFMGVWLFTHCGVFVLFFGGFGVCLWFVTRLLDLLVDGLM